MGLPAPVKVVPITAGTTSDPFEIQGELGYVIVGTVNTGTPTLTLQVTDEDDTGWTDTDITVTGSDSTKQLINSDTLAGVAGLCSHGPRFRWLSSGTVTVTINHYSKLM